MYGIRLGANLGASVAVHDRFSQARLHEATGSGCAATDTLQTALQRLVAVLGAGHGTPEERHQWTTHANSCIEHLEALTPVRKHIGGWTQATGRAREVELVAVDAETRLNSPGGALRHYEGAANAYIKLLQAIEASTGGPANRGAAKELPWFWFRSDTADLHRKCTVEAERLLGCMERLRPVVDAQKRAEASLAGTAFDMSGMAAALPSASARAGAGSGSHAPARPDLSSATGPFGSGRGLTQNEINVIKFTSRIQGKVFLPWQDAIDRVVAGSAASAAVGSAAAAGSATAVHKFVDPDGVLGLSKVQQKHFSRWVRPDDLFAGSGVTPVVFSGDRPTAYDVKQELVGTCSFLSSLCAAAEYEKRTGEPILTSKIFPQDSTGKPVVSPTGEYHVQLQLNGVWRCVVIDDLLPVDKHNKLLCSFSRTDGELWVSLLEKAFLKVIGTYAFPGSTSSKDLHVLTGWLPETVRASDEKFDSERTWRRMVSGHRYKDLLCTVATVDVPREAEERLGLVSSHAYAVLAVAEIAARGGALRLLKLKNPWSRKRFQGKMRFDNAAAWTPEVLSALGLRSTAAAIADDTGVFWVTWEEALVHFPEFFLSWKPSLLRHRASWHGSWPRASPGPIKDRYSFQFNPQFALTLTGTAPRGPVAVAAAAVSSTGGATVRAAPASGGLLWVLVTKHVTRITPDNDDDDADADEAVFVPRGRAGAPVRDSKTCLALHVFGDKRVVNAADSETSQTSFAATTLGGVGLDPDDSRTEAPAAGSAGGGASGAAGSSAETPVCGSGALAGERVFFPTDGIISPHIYSPAPYLVTKVAVHPGALAPGKQARLTMVLSQLERNRDVCYTVSVFASHPVQLAPVPVSFPLYAPLQAGAWAPGCDGGRAGSERYFENPQFRLTLTASDSIQLYLNGPSTHSIGIRVFRHADGDRVTSFRSEQVGTSQYYSKCLNVVTVRSLAAGTYVVLVATFEQGVHSRFKLAVAGAAHTPQLVRL